MRLYTVYSISEHTPSKNKTLQKSEHNVQKMKMLQKISVLCYVVVVVIFNKTIFSLL